VAEQCGKMHSSVHYGDIVLKQSAEKDKVALLLTKHPAAGAQETKSLAAAAEGVLQLGDAVLQAATMSPDDPSTAKVCALPTSALLLPPPRPAAAAGMRSFLVMLTPAPCQISQTNGPMPRWVAGQAAAAAQLCKRIDRAWISRGPHWSMQLPAPLHSTQR
jgi:hypothetical protein